MQQQQQLANTGCVLCLFGFLSRLWGGVGVEDYCICSLLNLLFNLNLIVIYIAILSNHYRYIFQQRGINVLSVVVDRRLMISLTLVFGSVLEHDSTLA